MYSHTHIHTHTHTHTHTCVCVCVCACVTNTDTRRSSIEGNIVNNRPGLITWLLVIISVFTLVWGVLNLKNSDYSLQNLVGHKLDVVSARDEFI
jgi:uncharacterized membrane protein YiaA